MISETIPLFASRIVLETGKNRQLCYYSFVRLLTDQNLFDAYEVLNILKKVGDCIFLWFVGL